MNDARDLAVGALARRVTALEAALALVSHRHEKEIAELQGRFEALLDRIENENKEQKCLK